MNCQGRKGVVEREVWWKRIIGAAWEVRNGRGRIPSFTRIQPVAGDPIDDDVGALAHDVVTNIGRFATIVRLQSVSALTVVEEDFRDPVTTTVLDCALEPHRFASNQDVIGVKRSRLRL